jgi:hypothetical protein
MEEIMGKEYNIIPFVSVGEIQFGMAKDNILKLFESEPIIDKDFLNKIHLKWDFISIILNKEGLASEITISESDNEIIYCGKNLFKNKKIIKVFDEMEEPIINYGYRIYVNTGIGFVDWNRKRNRVITIFAKEMIKEYKKLNK